jgi:hypothetical protein
MKIFILLALIGSLSAKKPDADFYIEKFTEFCSRLNNNVCTDEMIETGLIYFEKQVKELKNKMDEKRRKTRKEARFRQIQQIREQRLLQQLREHFLDRHI